MSTFLEIQDEVCANFTTTMRPRVKTWINQAYQEWLTFRRWRELEAVSSAVALVASQQAYDLLGGTPVVTDYAGMIAVELELSAGGARVPLREMDLQTFSLCTSHSRVNGVPAFWSVIGGAAASASSSVAAGGRQQIAVWPIPTAVAAQGVNVFLRYDRSTGSIALNGDGDIPILSPQYHGALVHGANAIGFENFNQREEAAGQRALFKERMLLAAGEDQSGRNRDVQRLQLVQQPWNYPIIGADKGSATDPPFPASR